MNRIYHNKHVNNKRNKSKKKYNVNTELQDFIKEKSQIITRYQSIEQIKNNCHIPDLIKAFSKEHTGVLSLLSFFFRFLALYLLNKLGFSNILASMVT